MRQHEDELGVVTADYWSGPYIVTFDEMADSMEYRCAVTMDALVTGLPLSQRLAVHHIHLNAVYRLNRRPVADVYLEARFGLSDGLRKKAMY